MKKLEIKNRLLEKTRPELQVISKKLGFKNYSKATKSELADWIIRNSNSRELKKEFKLKKKPTFIKVLVFIIPIIIAFVIYLLSPSKKDVEDVIDARFDTYEREVLKLDEYVKYISELEELNTKFLNEIFIEGYKVFGVRDNKFVNTNSYKNGKIVNEFSCSIEIDKKHKSMRTKLTVNMLRYASGDIKKQAIAGVVFSNIIRLGEIGEIISIPQPKLKYHRYNFVMLNQDLNNPVFAIGLGDIRINPEEVVIFQDTLGKMWQQVRY